MIISNNGNLFEHVHGTPGKIQVIMHSCNALGIMGSGIAKTVKEMFPEAYNAYLSALQGFHSASEALGSISHVLLVDRFDDPVFLVNIIGQHYYGKDGRKYTSYDAIDTALIEVDRQFSTLDIPIEFHFPTMGCGLGGGNWDVVSQIITHRLNRNHYTLNHWSL